MCYYEVNRQYNDKQLHEERSKANSRNVVFIKHTQTVENIKKKRNKRRVRVMNMIRILFIIMKIIIVIMRWMMITVIGLEKNYSSKQGDYNDGEGKN
jgi:hypothetical protein